MNKRLLLTLLTGTALTGAWAADSDAFANEKDKISYALGMNMGGNLHRLSVPLGEVNLEVMLQGFKDAEGKETPLDQSQMVSTLQGFQRSAWAKVGELNSEKGKAFLVENKSKEGVKTLEISLGDDKAAEMQYKVLAEGTGESPQSSDSVTVNYRGTLIDGTEFDSSYKRGKPASFGVTRVIKGWTEALQRMKPGSKWQLWIPPELGYGQRGSGKLIGPNATLVFEVELLSVKGAVQRQPVTSDIIKVPSKAEMDKGAQIEVIKASELEEYKKKEQEAKQAKEKQPAEEKKDE